MVNLLLNPLDQHPVQIHSLAPAQCLLNCPSHYLVCSGDRLFLFDLIDGISLQLDPQGKMIKQTKGVTECRLELKPLGDLKRESLSLVRGVHHCLYLPVRSKASTRSLTRRACLPLAETGAAEHREPPALLHAHAAGHGSLRSADQANDRQQLQSGQGAADERPGGDQQVRDRRVLERKPGRAQDRLPERALEPHHGQHRRVLRRRRWRARLPHLHDHPPHQRLRLPQYASPQQTSKSSSPSPASSWQSWNWTCVSCSSSSSTTRTCRSPKARTRPPCSCIRSGRST